LSPSTLLGPVGSAFPAREAQKVSPRSSSGASEARTGWVTEAICPDIAWLRLLEDVVLAPA